MTPSEVVHSRIYATAAGANNSRTSLIGSRHSNKPIGIRIFGSCFEFGSSQSKRTYHKALVLLMTYIAYASFHMGRRPLSIVKNVLNRNCSVAPSNQHILPQFTDLSQEGFLVVDLAHSQSANTTQAYSAPVDTSCNWAPFDDNNTANQLLAILDSAFLLSYALFMFASGILAERTNLRYFISSGSVLSGLGLIAFGLAYSLDIHSMTYYLIIQVTTGATQTTGWPVAVTCVSNWFEPTKRGLIYGLWNSHTSLGNILGAVIAGVFVEKDWGLSFIVPGLIMIAVGLMLFLFLVPSPSDVDLAPSINSKETAESNRCNACQSNQDLATNREHSKTLKTSKAVSFMTALRIPGVIEYSLCLFFSKLVSYTFLYWLPRYISASTSSNSEDSAYLSTPFDVGGIVGAILAGHISDKSKASGITCMIMLILAIPSMFMYQHFGSISNLYNISLQLLVGALVNGPYCLITTAVSADLGCRVKDGRAMATVAAIIDGMGSIGAVVGPLFAGFVSNSGDWQAVFVMLMLSDVLASLCLIRIFVHEIREKLTAKP